MILTIFTPTYNRCECLKKLYGSLKLQKCADFEWLIVDDGSNDNTDEVVKEIEENAEFSVRYIKKPNGGKHTAYNLAVDAANGEYFFCVDSDDFLSESSIQNIIDFISERKNVSGIIAYKRTINGQLLSNKFPEGLNTSTLFDLNNMYKCNGEFSIILKTYIAQSYKFPVFEGELFLGECVIYDIIGNTYKFHLLREAITICEYKSDGLTSNFDKLMKNNPAGYCLYFMQRIDYQDSIFKRFIIAGKYHCFCKFATEQKSSYTGRHPITVALARPLGIVFLLYYKMMRGF